VQNFDKAGSISENTMGDLGIERTK